ncbi:MAG: hypothetical protein ABI411_03855 [Tahibacter sp.]
MPRTRRKLNLRSAITSAALSLACATGPVHAAFVDELFLDGYETACGNLIYSEPFSGADGSAWPSPWVPIGNVALSDIQLGTARLRPGSTNYSLARMHAAVANRNVELRYRLRMDDIATQGVGFYVRQNAGYLTQTPTHGQGYAAFVETNFRGQPGISVWKEENGDEIQLLHAPAPSPAMANGVDYRVRFQVVQVNAGTTRVRASLWRAIDVEPTLWQASVDDTTAVLQNISGGLAIDSWSVLLNPASITAHTYVDDIEAISLCSP